MIKNEKMKAKIIINTCENPATIKYCKNGELVSLISWDQKKDKADSLIKKIDRVLHAKHLTPADVDFEIDEFCPSGSYTGHRIGVSVVNAINFSFGRKKRFSARYGMEPKITKKSSNFRSLISKY